MYLLVAVFNKENLEDVIEELVKNNIEGITIVETMGMGNFGFCEFGQKRDLFPKVKIEIVVSSDITLEIAKECIRTHCHDLGHGSGKMWWLKVDGVERIRTGEKDVDALTTQIDKKIKNDATHFECVDTPCS